MTSFAVREDRLLQLSEDLKGLVEKTVSGVNNETYSPKAKELRHNLKAAADPDRIQGFWGGGGRGEGAERLVWSTNKGPGPSPGSALERGPIKLEILNSCKATVREKHGKKS